MIKWFFCIGLLAASLTPSFAFSLLGPVANANPGSLTTLNSDKWQTPANGFNPTGPYSEPLGIIDQAPQGPKNLGEEYRCNAPVMYYACDANFLDFFGMSGLMAVEQAFAVLNDLTNVDSYSSDLSEFPLQSEAINYTAQQWDLLDLKSTALAAMIEQIGLADPIRYSWVIHDRYTSDLTCPDFIYFVASRNFDLLTPLPDGSAQYYSPYVNDTLYFYRIFEYCADSKPPSPRIAAAMAYNANDDEYFNTPVASGFGIQAEGYGGAHGSLLAGGYYTGLTRDDVQGLRYLYSTNNVNYEPSANGSVLLSSSGGGGAGYGAPFALYSSNYMTFALTALNTDPATLQTMFPTLAITSSTNFSVVVPTVTIIAYFTNFVGAPAGSPPAIYVTTNTTYSVVQNYAYTFANLVINTNGYSTNTSAQLVLTTVLPAKGAPAGSPFVTNTTFKTVTLTNVPSGDYFINTNYACGPVIILGTLLTNVMVSTNILYAVSNSAGEFESESLVIYSTSHVFSVQSPICGTTTNGSVASVTGLYQGAGKLQFVQANYDSLLGIYFQPVTNTYTMVYITNYLPVRQTFQRVVTAPDYIFSAQDLTAGTGGSDETYAAFYRTLPGFSADPSPSYAGLAGPGVITNGNSAIVFNKVGVVQQYYLGGTNNFWLFGSFDGTTNKPIVYPDATSIAKLEAAVLIQVSPSSPGGLPSGTSNTVYRAAISAVGGQSPYTWSLTQGQLPDGLGLSTASLTNCVISGTPTNRGTYYFTIQMIDSSPSVNTLNWDYSITIN